MPSKPRTLAGILRSRRHADAEYNRARRDPVVARIHGSARWQAVRARVLRDEPVCRECARLGVTEPATQVDHLVPVGVAPELAFDRANLAPTCTACHARKSTAERRGEGGPADSHALGPPSGARGVSRLFTGYGNPAKRPAQAEKWPSEERTSGRGGAVIRVPLKAAQRDLAALVRAVEDGQERVVLTRRGRPVAALLPPGALAALDLLGRMLPAVADVARDLPPLDPQAPGLGPAPDPEAERALRSRLSAAAAPPPPETP